MRFANLRRLDLELDLLDMEAALRQLRHDEGALQLVQQLGGNPGRCHKVSKPTGLIGEKQPLDLVENADGSAFRRRRGKARQSARLSLAIDGGGWLSRRSPPSPARRESRARN